MKATRTLGTYSEMNGKTEHRDFQNLAKAYFARVTPFFPTIATQLGLRDYDHLLESYSKDRCQDFSDFLKAIARDLEKIPRNRLRPSDLLDSDLMRVEIRNYLMRLEELATWRQDPVLYPETVLHSAYFLVARENMPWPERAASLLSRMKLFPRLLEEGRKNLRHPPGLFTEIAIEVTEGGIHFFKRVQFQRRTLTAALHGELEKERSKTLEHLESYHRWLSEKLLPASNGDFAVGKDCFNRILKSQHLLPYTSTDLRAIGDENLKQTLAEMKRVSRSIDPKKGWVELLQEGSKRHPTTQSLLKDYQKIVQTAREFIASHRLAPLPKHDEVIVTLTPSFNRSFIPFAAYMPAPPFEHRAGGEFWVTPVPAKLSPHEHESRLKEHAYHKIPLIVLHETYPGHHLQFSFLREISSPFVKRGFSSVSCEGWAFYCEEMMKEQGFYPNPLSLLSQLRDQLWRITRVILDVGLQTERMSPQKAADLLVRQVGFPHAMAWGEVKRYVRDATQPMSYFIGKHEILRLRKAYQKKRSGKFKLYDFHRDFLKCGVIPIKLAEQKLLSADW